MLCSSSGLCRFEGQVWLWLGQKHWWRLMNTIDKGKDLSIAILFIKPHVKIQSILKILGICLWWTRRTCLSSKLGLPHLSLSLLAKTVLVSLNKHLVDAYSDLNSPAWGGGLVSGTHAVLIKWGSRCKTRTVSQRASQVPWAIWADGLTGLLYILNPDHELSPM